MAKAAKQESAAAKAAAFAARHNTISNKRTAGKEREAAKAKAKQARLHKDL